MNTLTFTTGLLEEGHCYGTQELRKLLNLSQWGMDRIKDMGLAYTKIGKQHFYEGADVIQFIKSHKTSRKLEDK